MDFEGFGELKVSKCVYSGVLYTIIDIMCSKSCAAYDY